MSEGTGTARRDFAAEIRSTLFALCDVLREARAAGEVYTFQLGYDPAKGGDFIEKLTVTTDALAPKEPIA